MVASPPFLKGRDPPPQTERERILCSGLLPVSRGSLLCASRVWGSFTRRGAGEQGGCSMESQNQSSLVTSSGENGDAAVSSSGVSLVKDLIYWRDPKKTGVVFGSILTLLVSLAVFSVVSVLAYLVLALLSVTISFRIYKSVVQAVQKTNDGNPFKPYLEQDITLSSETFHKYCTIGFTHLNRVLKYLLQLFLVQDLVDSLKLAVLMWLMTYVGAVFNGLTLLILAVLLTFSVPIIYQAYQTQIDHYIELVQKQAVCAFGKIQEKLPGAKRKSE
ncbi:reticulon-3-A-like isoform X3 [Chiloscyllium punctatum]|uniref:reticulon-3-A-like isoform X3 n=1 Tax=Chiloscyllium punctatum TaxID=137246 RepID=UPI003B631C80